MLSSNLAISKRHVLLSPCRTTMTMPHHHHHHTRIPCTCERTVLLCWMCSRDSLQVTPDRASFGSSKGQCTTTLLEYYEGHRCGFFLARVSDSACRFFYAAHACGSPDCETNEQIKANKSICLPSWYSHVMCLGRGGRQKSFDCSCCNPKSAAHGVWRCTRMAEVHGGGGVWGRRRGRKDEEKGS